MRLTYLQTYPYVYCKRGKIILEKFANALNSLLIYYLIFFVRLLNLNKIIKNFVLTLFFRTTKL